MTTNHKPATLLPWELKAVAVPGGYEFSIRSVDLNRGDYVADVFAQGDAEYIMRRLDAYPRLIDLARFVASQDPNRVTKQGERARALLRDLGEV